MKNFKYLVLESLINEGRLDDVIKKYATNKATDDSLTMGEMGKLPEPVIRELSQKDPSGNNKYLEWMVKVIVQLPLQKKDVIAKVKCFHENLERLSEKNVKAIYGEDKWQNPSAEDGAVIERINKIPKDISSYPSHLWLKPMCEYFEELQPKNATRIKLYEDDKLLIVSPLTHKAACDYGIHTNWCVSTANASYFGTYTKDGILVFFLDKKGKNPLKTRASDYKFAVNPKFNKPEPQYWPWYSMEDAPVDPILMMNLLPKQYFEVIEKYLAEISAEMVKKSALDEKELTEKSVIWFKRNAQQYYIVPKIESWDEASITTSTQWLNKFFGNQPIAPQILARKEQGLPVIQLNVAPPSLPYGYVDLIPWQSALSKRRPDNTILKTDFIIAANDRWGGFQDHIRNFLAAASPETKEKFYNFYMKMFNAADVTKNDWVSVSTLNLGDSILYRPAGRRWGNGEPARVVRVSEKSITLSNGKRMLKSTTSQKEKIVGKLKMVDTPITPAAPAAPRIGESKWTRTRII